MGNCLFPNSHLDCKLIKTEIIYLVCYKCKWTPNWVFLHNGNLRYFWLNEWILVDKPIRYKLHDLLSNLDNIRSDQSLSCVWLLVTPWNAACQASLSIKLPEFTQTYVHWVGDAVQPSHPLSSPSPPAFNLSQHQGLFKWVSSSHQVSKVLEFQLQHQSFQWIFRTDFL